MTTQIDIGSIAFNTFTPDGAGVSWLITEWDGWESPDVTFASVDLTGRSGAYPTPTYLHTRTLIYTGIVKAPSEAAYRAALDTFMVQAFSGGVNADLRVKHYEDITRYCDTRLASKPKIKKFSSYFTFQLSLTSVNPYKYNVTAGSQTFTTGSSHVLANAGNAPTFPVFTLTATGTVDIANTTITGSPEVKTASVASGSILTFDPVSVKDSGGVDLYDTVDSAATQWWTLVPGNNTITHTGANGTLTWNDAYI